MQTKIIRGHKEIEVILCCVSASKHEAERVDDGGGAVPECGGGGQTRPLRQRPHRLRGRGLRLQEGAQGQRRDTLHYLQGQQGEPQEAREVVGQEGTESNENFSYSFR